MGWVKCRIERGLDVTIQFDWVAIGISISICALELVEAARLNVSSMVLIEVIQLIVDIDGSLNLCINFDGDSAVLANTFRTIDLIAVELNLLNDLITHNVKGNS